MGWPTADVMGVPTMTAAWAILALPLALLLASCGSPASTTRVPAVTPAATASPAAPAAATPAPQPATPAPTLAPAPPPLIVVAEGSGSGQKVSLVDLSGRTLASATTTADKVWEIEAGPGGAYWESAGRLHRLGADGRLIDLGPAPAAGDRGFSVSPTGDAIAYGTSTPIGSGQQWDNRLYVAQGGQARLLASRISDGSKPAPPDALQGWQYRTMGWTDQGILIAREPQGGCGCGPFGMESVDWHTAVVDPNSGATTPINDSATCPLSGVGPGGEAACFHTPVSGESRAADSLRILRGGAVTASFDLSRTTVGGAAVFSPDGGRIAYATVAEGTDCGTWQQQTTMRILDIAGGTAKGLSTPGLQPVAWLPDGRILATRTVGPAGDTQLVLVDPASGATTTLRTVAGWAIVRVVAAA
jgi:hypothetical protein